MIEAAGPKFCPCSARHSNMLSNHMVRVMERDLNVPDGRALLGKSDVFGYPGKLGAHITVGHYGNYPPVGGLLFAALSPIRPAYLMG